MRTEAGLIGLSLFCALLGAKLHCRGYNVMSAKKIGFSYTEMDAVIVILVRDDCFSD